MDSERVRQDYTYKPVLQRRYIANTPSRCRIFQFNRLKTIFTLNPIFNNRKNLADTTEHTNRNSSYRTSRILFSVVITLISLMIIWPGYTIFSSATPFILGFPLSFAWIIFCTIAGFIALLALYISDNNRQESD